MCNEYLPTPYSGLSLGVKQNSVQVWDRLEERFHKRLALWKKKCISKGVSLSHKKHFIRHAHLHYVSIMLTKGCKFHVGKNPKGFSLSREPSEEIPFGKLETCMFDQIEGCPRNS